MPAAKVALPGREAPDARPVRAVDRKRTGACGAGGGRGRGRLSACGAGSRQDLWPEEKRHSRVDGQVCPSTRLLMVRAPAGSPYETSTNRWVGGLMFRRARGRRAGCSFGAFAAIGAGFVRLVAGRTRSRPAGACGRRSRGRRGAAGHETRLGKGPDTPRSRKRSRIPVGEGCRPPFPRIHPSLTGFRDQKRPPGAPEPFSKRISWPFFDAGGVPAPGARSGGPSSHARRREGAVFAVVPPACRRPGQNSLSLEGGIT